jgi:hypothetical protein
MGIWAVILFVLLISRCHDVSTGGDVLLSASVSGACCVCGVAGVSGCTCTMYIFMFGLLGRQSALICVASQFVCQKSERPCQLC